MWRQTLLALLIGVGSTQSTQVPPSSFPAHGDEFVGPFSSWINVKAAYGAIGDGMADDTRAIQRALDQLGDTGDRSPVLYFPSGTYRITATLSLSFRIYVSLVGEDPDLTTIEWDGASGGTMFLVNGVAYSRLTRLTFNGSRRASVAVEQSWDGSKPHFDTGNEYSDARFVDVEYGLRGGFKDRGFAETSIQRARFIRNSKAGVALGNFNALDIWIWQSLFEDCNVGITNDPGAGNFHVYQSVFRRSTTADLQMRNTGGFSARDNFSSQSAAFFVSPSISHPATVDIQRNTIVASRGATPIRLGNQGPGLLLDNNILTSGVPAVSWRNVFGSDVVSAGNTYTAAAPLSVSGRLVTIDDRTSSRPAQMPIEPPLPEARPNLRRRVFDVERGADARAIQRAIDSASQAGSRSVVHLPFGAYSIDQTLILPPGDVQLVGDGMGTALHWSGTASGPLLRIQGPTRATLRELQLHGNAAVDAVRIDGADQPGSRVSLNGVELREAESHNLLVRDAPQVELQLVDIGHAQAKGASFQIDRGRVTIFSGASSNNALSYDVTGGAQVVIRDIWYEGSASRGFASIHGGATFTMQGARVATTGTHPPSFDIRDLDGSVTLLTTNLDDRIVVTGELRGSRVLGVGILRDRQSQAYFSSSASPGGRALLLNGRQQSEPGGLLNSGSHVVPDVGTMDEEFVRGMLSGTRATLGPTLDARPAAASDVRMFRVWITRGLTNLTIAGTPR